MSDTKFTPGPWFCGGNPCEAGDHEKALDICKEIVNLTGDGSGYFMEVWVESGLRTALVGHGPNGINNANLIAAAPELYEALEESNRIMAEAIGQLMEMGRDGLILANSLNRQYPKNSKALAKARGEM